MCIFFFSFSENMSINNCQPGNNLIEEFEKIQNEDELNECAKKLRNYFQTLRGLTALPKHLPKKGPNAQKNCRVDKNNKHEIQALYRYQEHRAVQEILFESSFCTIDKEKIEKHYSKLLSNISGCKILEIPTDLWKNNASPSANDDSKLNKKFTAVEVKSKLKLKIHSKLFNSKSVGLDELQFRDLKKYDPDLSILTAFFNACLRIQKIPEIWKEFYSVLIKIEGNDGEDLKNWKTVTMQNTTSKLFQSLVASRLIVWAKDTKRLSLTQKGYQLNNAACESSFILQECKKYAQKNEKDLAVAWLEFSNASDSIPQEVIHYALEQHMVPRTYKNLIYSILKDNHTSIRLKNEIGYSKKIPIIKGLPQGSPLAPILIHLAIEPILRRLDSEKNNVFELYNQKVNHIAISDEISLIAESKEKLQNLLKSVEEVSKLIGLKFNIDKCVTYYCDKNHQTQDDKFIFFGQKLQTFPDEKINEYFGVRQGLSIGQPGIPTINEMLESVEHISTSLLHQFQKLDAVQSFIIPRVENCLRGIQQFDEKKLENVEDILTDKVKIWLSLPPDASAASVVFQAANISNNSAKILPFLDLFYIMKIVQAFNMLTSEDKVVKNIAIKSLEKEVAEMTQDEKINVTLKHLADYLSGDLSIKASSNTKDWLLVREATQKINEKINLKWLFSNRQLQLKIKDFNDKKPILLTDNIRFKVGERLKSQLIFYYIKEINNANPGIFFNL